MLERQPLTAIVRADPWRRRMWRTAEKLRHLDACRFEPQIALIEECLHRDAHWSLEDALTTCERWGSSSALDVAAESM